MQNFLFNRVKDRLDLKLGKDTTGPAGVTSSKQMSSKHEASTLPKMQEYMTESIIHILSFSKMTTGRVTAFSFGHQVVSGCLLRHTV